MSWLVPFDQKGVVGPAMTLIYHSSSYSEQGVLALANVLKENVIHLIKVKPKGKKQFCAFVIERNRSQSSITPTEIISTAFFQNMQKRRSSSCYHEQILELIVPRMLKTVHEQFPQANVENKEIREWTAGLIESYMTEEQIRRHCEIQSSVSNEIMEKRQSIGKDLYQAVIAKQLTKEDLDMLIHVTDLALKSLKTAEHCSLILNLTGRYFILFSMDQDNPLLLGKDVLDFLSTIFREKMFPKNI